MTTKTTFTPCLGSLATHSAREEILSFHMLVGFIMVQLINTIASAQYNL